MFGVLTLSSLGYGLHQLWIYAAMFGYERFFNLEPLIALENVGISTSLMTLVSITSLGLTLIVCAITDQKNLKAYVDRPLAIVGTAGMAIGAAMLVPASSLAGTAAVAVEVVSGLLTGIGSGILIIYWGTAFARLDAMSIAINTAIALVFALTIYGIVLHNIPLGLAQACIVIAPLVGCGILFSTMPAPYYKRNEPPIFDALPEKKLRFCCTLGIPMLVLGFALGILRQTSLQLIVPGATLETQLLILLAAVCAALIILIAAMVTSHGESWNSLSHILIPVVALSALFITGAATDSLSVGSFLILIGYLCTEAFVWTFLGELAHRYRLSPILVYGTGRGCLALGSGIGLWFPLSLDYFDAFDAFGDYTITVITLLAIVVAYALLPDERDIARCAVYTPPAGTIVEAEAIEQGLRAPAEQADADDAGGSGSEAGAAEAADETPTNPAEAQHGAGEDAGAAAEHRKRWFRENCRTVTERYLLSQRESEVLALLAKGFNAAAIQEKLYISEGTAKTHIRHIYRKLDVHSQQELIRMVETIDKTEDGR